MVKVGDKVAWAFNFKWMPAVSVEEIHAVNGDMVMLKNVASRVFSARTGLEIYPNSGRTKIVIEAAG